MLRAINLLCDSKFFQSFLRDGKSKGFNAWYSLWVAFDLFMI